MCLCCCAYGLKADVVTGLYDAAVDIAKQSEQAQNAAIQTGLKQVLVKISGTPDILREAGLKPYVKRAREFTRQLQFVTQDQQLSLLISFDASKIDDLIRQLDYPIWGSYRPSTILWLVREQEQFDRRILSENDDVALRQALNNYARQRGVGLLYPVLDLEDLQRISVYDVWGLFTDSLAGASERYGVEVIYGVRVYPEQVLDAGFVESDPILRNGAGSTAATALADPSASGATEADPATGKLQADWLLLLQGDYLTGSLVASSEADLAAQLMTALADELARRYAVKGLTDTAQAQRVVIALEQVDSIGDYVAAKRYFESLQVVNSATLISLTAARAQFELTLQGRVEDVLAVFQLDDRIQRQRDFFGTPEEELVFTWDP